MLVGSPVADRGGRPHGHRRRLDDVTASPTTPTLLVTPLACRTRTTCRLGRLARRPRLLVTRSASRPASGSRPVRGAAPASTGAGFARNSGDLRGGHGRPVLRRDSDALREALAS